MDDYIVHPSYFEIASKTAPTTPIEALMTADFGEPVEESALEREVRKQALAVRVDKALAQLDGVQREVVERYVLEGASLRQLAVSVQRPDGSYYGKTWIAHIRDEGLAIMREFLLSEEGKE